MAAAAILHPIIRRSKRNHALQFIHSIESTWKGHEDFAIWLVQKIQPKTVVDLGFDRGLSTIAFAYKNPGHVYGIDWFEEGTYAEKSFALDTAFRNIARAIRFNYAKNIHLIIGPFHEVSKTWNRKIDILHIDWAHTYRAAKFHFDNWQRYLRDEGVVLIHDILSCPNEVGRFFKELPFPKILFPDHGGLGVICSDKKLIEEIRTDWQL
ncbi:MAG: class I SAM-dependent methyltransferase [Verrucomicrobiota bacterium]|nr:class I SAM-dependent methyltransferase [Verrucomicrobiota bacterium]